MNKIERAQKRLENAISALKFGECTALPTAHEVADPDAWPADRPRTVYKVVDGSTRRWHPDFVMSLEFIALVQVVAHETMHALIDGASLKEKVRA